MTAVPGRDELREHLVRARIAGDVRTPRQSNLANIEKMLDRRWDYWFGLDLDREWTAGEVLDLLVKRVGVEADPGHVAGADTIDPDLTLDALDRAADRIAAALHGGERVLVATGHPTGILSLHLALADAVRRSGAALLEPAAETRLPALGERLRIRYLGGVAMLTNGADFLHTHAAEPMQAALAALGAPPDLVVADHGWAGAAAQAGIDTVGFADCNDPALFVGEAEGKVAVAVPLDDNVAPDLYLPLAAYLLRHAAPNG